MCPAAVFLSQKWETVPKDQLAPGIHDLRSQYTTVHRAVIPATGLSCGGMRVSDVQHWQVRWECVELGGFSHSSKLGTYTCGQPSAASN